MEYSNIQSNRKNKRQRVCSNTSQKRVCTGFQQKLLSSFITRTEPPEVYPPQYYMPQLTKSNLDLEYNEFEMSRTEGLGKRSLYERQPNWKI